MMAWSWPAFIVGVFAGIVLALLAVLGLVCLLAYWKHKDGGIASD